MNQPLVSVIMNCYNCDGFLREAIDSVYAQTYSNWEIVFWDNASVDKSASIAKDYDQRLRYFVVKNTTLLGDARVKAVKKAKGELLAFLDCDDLWEVSKLEKQVNLFENQKLGIVYSRCNLISDKGKVLGQFPRSNDMLISGDVFADLVKQNFISFVSAVVPREIYNEVGGFPENYKNSTDYYLFLKVAYSYKVAVVDEVLCNYRIHYNNLSQKQSIIGLQESIDAVKTFLPDRRAIEGLKYQHVDLFIIYVKEMKFIRALTLLVRHRIFFVFLQRIKKSLYGS